MNMEDNEKNYEKLIKLLSAHEPEMADAEELTESIMTEIRKEKQRDARPAISLYWIFGWILVPWMRNSLTTAMVLILLFSVFQLTSLNRKVDILENQLIRSGYNYYQSPYASKQDLIKNVIPASENKSDSIRVSKDDLFNLLNAYRDLENQSRENQTQLKQKNGIRHFLHSDPKKTKNNEKYPSL